MSNVNNLIKADKDFSIERFKSYASNIFVQVMLAIMKKDLNKVRHFISDELEEKFQNKINTLNKNGYIQIYDELNVADIKPLKATIYNDCYILKTKVVLKSIDYIIDDNSKVVISGNNKYRTDKKFVLTFEKRKNFKLQDENRICPNCGANIDVNYNGKCSYCGSIYNLEDFNWILVKIKD